MKTTLIIAALLLSGCATTDNKDFYQAQQAAETAKFGAIKELAVGADPTTRALLAVMLGGGMAGGQGGIKQAAPDTTALQWASVLVPGAVQAYGITANMQLGVRQSDNGASVARSTNDTFFGIASRIQAPVTITNTDRHDVITPTPVVTQPVIVAPAVPVVVNPPVVITPVFVPGK